MKQLAAERALMRRSHIHHLAREAQLERILAHLIDCATHSKCKCETAKAVRLLAHELRSDPRA